MIDGSGGGARGGGRGLDGRAAAALAAAAAYRNKSFKKIKLFKKNKKPHTPQPWATPHALTKGRSLVP